MAKVTVIGAGFAGLSASAYLSQAGHEVTLLEQHDQTGGRARSWQSDGFTFDMGPSWYWMPDVFERFFNDFGKHSSNYYNLIRLDPSYRIFFEEEEMDIPANMEALRQLFEGIEPGSAKHLDKFMAEASKKYEVGIQELVYKPSLKASEYLDWRIVSGLAKMHLLTPFSKYVRKHFSDSRLIRLLEFPILFLGAKPKDTPALYSLMNYADLSLGTWYPMGGMHNIVRAMTHVAKEQGVNIQTSAKVEKIQLNRHHASSIIVNAKELQTDAVVAAADYHFVESKLLPESHQSYNSQYWDSRTLAPSALIFYLGIDKEVRGLKHHNLFFDHDFAQHAKEIYDSPQWPKEPLFYVCAPSKTDSSVAPKGCENLFILMPIAPGIEDNEAIREEYFQLLISRLESRLGTSLREHITVKRSYCIKNFEEDYNSFKGNAYGLANTLKQTALFKPKMKSKKVKNLFYTGQLTVPGPGVPPSIISGQVSAKLVSKQFKPSIS